MACTDLLAKLIRTIELAISTYASVWRIVTALSIRRAVPGRHSCSYTTTRDQAPRRDCSIAESSNKVEGPRAQHPETFRSGVRAEPQRSKYAIRLRQVFGTLAMWPVLLKLALVWVMSRPPLAYFLRVQVLQARPSVSSIGWALHASSSRETTALTSWLAE